MTGQKSIICLISAMPMEPRPPAEQLFTAPRWSIKYIIKGRAYLLRIEYEQAVYGTTPTRFLASALIQQFDFISDIFAVFIKKCKQRIFQRRAGKLINMYVEANASLRLTTLSSIDIRIDRQIYKYEAQSANSVPNMK